MNKKGFTLIELLAVIVILGVLMLVAIPAVSRYVNDAKKQAFLANTTSIVKTVKSEAALKGKTKCYAQVSSVELEKGNLSGFGGYVYVNQNGSNYEIVVDIVDTNNKLAFYNKNFNNVSTSTIEQYSTTPSVDSSYTESCLAD